MIKIITIIILILIPVYTLSCESDSEKFTQEDIDRLQERIDDLEEQYGSLKEDYDSLLKEKDLLEGQIDELKGNVASKIPSHYYTYTDEMDVFSISYPPDWELALSEIEGLEQYAIDLYEHVESSSVSLEGGFIFIAGLPREAGYSPNVNIFYEPLQGINYDHDEAVELAITGIKQSVTDYHEYNRVKDNVDEREMTIVEWGGTYPYLGELYLIQMYTISNDVLWLVTCTAEPGEVDEYRDDLYHIARSLRIHKQRPVSRGV